mgnify:CR=1 FL=1
MSAATPQVTITATENSDGTISIASQAHNVELEELEESALGVVVRGMLAGLLGDHSTGVHQVSTPTGSA